MTPAARVAVTGANGRLGRALVAALAARGVESRPFTRPDYDLDDPSAAARVIAEQPTLVVHPAAWTDVDGCARDAELGYRRNAAAVGELARACAKTGVGLLVVSTNEVFDGTRGDGRGYSETDDVNPINAYGESKLAGEKAARDAFAAHGRPDLLWIARTAWLFGPPGNDFPTKIVAAADRLATGAALRVVDDEIGSPTYTPDLAAALLDLTTGAPAGTYHLAAAGHASRCEVARNVIARCRPGTAIDPISQREFQRASSPPAWGVLDTSQAASFGIVLRDWREALADYLVDVC